MSEKHTPVKTFDCQGCRPYCYGGYHMEADKDGFGDYVKAEDFRDVEKQRDELLAAAKLTLTTINVLGRSMPIDVCDALEAAIAKVEGGAA